MGLFVSIYAALDDYALNQTEEEISNANCSSLSGIKYIFKAIWKSFLILYSLYGAQNNKPIACFCLVMAFIASLASISFIYDLNPFTDDLQFNPAGLGLEWPGSVENSSKFYTFITCIFVHLNFLHFFKNTVLFIFCGFYLEVKYGTWYLLIAFFTSAIFGEFGQLFMNSNFLTLPWTSTEAVYLGSSTGVMGLMGVFVAETLIGAILDTRLVKYIYFKYTSSCLLMVTFTAEVIYSIWDNGRVAVWMHIYGFAFGFIVVSAIVSWWSLADMLRDKSHLYIELNELNFSNFSTNTSMSILETESSITVEDLDASGPSAKNETDILEHVELPVGVSICKKILFSLHFSAALIYFSFVIFSVWKVFAST